MYLVAPVLHPKDLDWAGVRMGRAATDGGASAGKDRAEPVRPALGAGLLEGINRPGGRRHAGFVRPARVVGQRGPGGEAGPTFQCTGQTLRLVTVWRTLGVGNPGANAPRRGGKQIAEG